MLQDGNQTSLTLSYKCLAGVKQHFATLYDHALNGQVLPDVLCFTHFIMHDSERNDKNRCISLKKKEIREVLRHVVAPCSGSLQRIFVVM